MSLINEALKKAQRQRHEETGEPATAAALPALEPAPGFSPGEAAPVRRGKTSGASTLVLVGSAAVVLVVLSVVVTVILLNRSPHSPPAAPVAAARPAAAPPAPSVNAPAEAPPPPLTPPVITPPVVTAPAPVATAPATVESAAPVPTPAATVPAVVSAPPLPPSAPAAAPTASASAVSTPALPPPAAAPVAATPATVAGPAKPDERIARFVEAIKVTGIRSSGAESRVLMNDRVYRVNDTVERTLGVKLTKVEADQLTFADANGLTYIKGI